jgi:hypothetical protein
MRKWMFLFVFGAVTLLGQATVNAQCAMCKATMAKSEGRQATFKERAKGLNAGILYLMTIPYILAGVIGFYWYKSSKKEREKKEYVQRVIRSKVSSL